MRTTPATPSMAIDRGRIPDHLAYLDAVRGLAAFWVLASHAAVLNAVHWRVISQGGLAVDLFMMLSGFLMTYHYMQRSAAEPWSAPGTWGAFWIRRFFRIAPLFYILLILSFAVGTEVGEWRQQIATIWPSTATVTARYDDHSPINALLHLTFLFGLLPDYSFRSPLPDWSIGLEMQFYAAFPLIMLAWRRLGGIGVAALLLLVGAALQLLAPAYFAAYPLPANLAVKMGVFLTGMLLANALLATTTWSRIWLAGAALAVLLPQGLLFNHSALYFAFQLVIACGFAVLILHKQLATIIHQPLIEGLVDRLAWKPLKLLGDTSYSVYLLHLLVMIPIVGALSTMPAYVDLTQKYRVLITTLLTVVPVYTVGWLLHRTVEQSGIRYGKIVLGRLRAKVSRRDRDTAPLPQPSSDAS
jgi:peptidoglycan/LPS O-acetylase OafA/YrhL